MCPSWPSQIMHPLPHPSRKPQNFRPKKHTLAKMHGTKIFETLQTSHKLSKICTTKKSCKKMCIFGVFLWVWKKIPTPDLDDQIIPPPRCIILGGGYFKTGLVHWAGLLGTLESGFSLAARNLQEDHQTKILSLKKKLKENICLSQSLLSLSFFHLPNFGV